MYGTVQTTASKADIDKITGLQSNASEIDNVVDTYIDNNVTTLYAYALGTDATNDPDNGVYSGIIDNVNAIQRAIDSVPDISHTTYQIRCIGTFTATTFAEMSAVDSWREEYYAMVSITKDNIHLIGAGEKATVIFADLPDTGAPLNYSKYQTITVENKRCTLENMVIKGRNLRYPVHTEANSTGVSIDDATLTYKDVHFWHLGNTGQAIIDWTSLHSYGIGFGRRMNLNIDSCRFTSTVNAGFAGHDGYNTENANISVSSCLFDCTTNNNASMVIDFGLFGNIKSKVSFKLHGNNFNNGIINLGDLSQEGLGAYGTISGSGNSKFRFEQDSPHGYYPEVVDVRLEALNDTGVALAQYMAIDDVYALATGEIHAISFESSLDGEKYIAIKNTLILMSLLNIKVGETIVAGDYVEALNGELVSTLNKSTARCVDLSGTLYLSLA